MRLNKKKFFHQNQSEYIQFYHLINIMHQMLKSHTKVFKTIIYILTIYMYNILLYNLIIVKHLPVEILTARRKNITREIYITSHKLNILIQCIF